MEPVSVVIPTYNGVELLRRFLPSVAAALQEYKGKGEIIVVDDGGNDGTSEWLKREFPQTKLVSHKENMGFGPSANDGVKAAQTETVVLLNNDMSPHADFIEPLLERLRSKDDIFAVCAKSLIPDGSDESPTQFKDDNGILKLVQPGLNITAEPFSKAVTVAYAPGGMSIFRRDRFLELGGFDNLFRPFYWEDADLSWKAWQKGWRVLYEPRSVIEHLSHGTIGKFYKRQKYDLINQAHRHLFHLRHLEWDLLERYLRRVNRLATEINLFDFGVERRAFFVALARVNEVLERRHGENRAGVSTEAILELSSNQPVE